MSSFGQKSSLDIPEDIEKNMILLQEKFSLLEKTKIDLDKSISENEIVLKDINSKILVAQNELDQIVVQSKSITAGLDERETRIYKKENDLEVYETALKEKENKIRRYIAIFDGAKKIMN